jgi:hypothetical protein
VDVAVRGVTRTENRIPNTSYRPTTAIHAKLSRSHTSRPTIIRLRAEVWDSKYSSMVCRLVNLAEIQAPSGAKRC